MNQKITNLQEKFRLELYWYPIILFWLGAGSLFFYHLVTGFVPRPVMITLPIPGLPLDVYWYGAIIMAGIVLGAYVVAWLAEEKARRILHEHVPESLQQQLITEMRLPSEVHILLAKQKIVTVGELLLKWGFNPATLGVNDKGMGAVRRQLKQLPGIQSSLLDDAPWRLWNPDHVWGGVTYCLILGLIGARLYHVLTPSPSMAEVGIHSPLDYFRHPFQLINLRQGGLGIYGGIVGGLLGLIWYTVRHRLPTLGWADVAAVGLALGQSIGRWGNFFNQELYGRPANVPWAITIEPAHRLPGYTEFSQFHPAFLYESIWNFLAFLILLMLAHRYHRKLLSGDLMAVYFILYAIGRTLLETVRLDSRTFTLAGIDIGLPIATVVSLTIALLMALWLIGRRSKVQGVRFHS